MCHVLVASYAGFDVENECLIFQKGNNYYTQPIVTDGNKVKRIDRLHFRKITTSLGKVHNKLCTSPKKMHRKFLIAI